METLEEHKAAESESRLKESMRGDLGFWELFTQIILNDWNKETAINFLIENHRKEVEEYYE